MLCAWFQNCSWLNQSDSSNDFSQVSAPILASFSVFFRQSLNLFSRLALQALSWTSSSYSAYMRSQLSSRLTTYLLNFILEASPNLCCKVLDTTHFPKSVFWCLIFQILILVIFLQCFKVKKFWFYEFLWVNKEKKYIYLS